MVTDLSSYKYRVVFAFRFIIISALASLLTACTYGFIYTDVVEPLTINMTQTKMASDVGESGSHTLKEPVTGYGIRVEWASYGIGDTALRGDLDSIHYADVRYRSILGGLWQRRSVQVYGVKDGARSAAEVENKIVERADDSKS